MSTNKTPNLNLHSWVATDYVLRTEFNENFTAIDDAIGRMTVSGDVRVATTANITLSGTQTIDGIAVVAGNRVLVKNQTTGTQNGVWVVASGTWTRSLDADTTNKIAAGIVVFVEEGTTNGKTQWRMSNTGTVTLNTTSLTFEKVTYIHPNHTGDVTSTGDGVTAIAPGVIVNADINASAAIDATKIGTGVVSNTEFSYLDGVTSSIQTQLNGKMTSTSYTAADVLAKLITVDGAGSSLDADTLDTKHASDFAPSGYGLGTLAQNLANGTDLNTVITTGFYRVNTATNAPPRVTGDNSAIWHYLIVVAHDATSWQSQIAIEYSTGTMFTRARSSVSTWTPWRKYWNDDNLPMSTSSVANSGILRDSNKKIAEVAANRAVAVDSQLTTTAATTVATFTASAKALFTVRVYLRVAAARTVSIVVNYTDAGTTRSRVILPSTSMAIDAYDFIPVTLQAQAGSAINVVATTTVANSVFVSAVITEEG